MIEKLLHKVGLQRIKPKSGKRENVSGFAAASQGRLVASWNPVNMSMDAMMRYQLRLIRARSRDLSVNNPYIKKFVGMVITNVLGPTGINFQSQIKLKNGKFDTTKNDLIEAAWKKWGEKKNSPDVTGKLSWTGIQKLALRSVVRDGEVLIRKIRGFDNPSKFALQLIEADHLDENYNADLGNGNKIVMSVEVDPWSRPVAYHLFKNHPYDYFGGMSNMLRRERVPADEIIHLFTPLRIGQKRGLPWFYAVAAKTNILDGFQEAALVASRIAAAQMGVIETPDSMCRAESEDSSGRQEITADPGAFPVLGPGEKMTMFDPKHPSTQYDKFTTQVVREIASGLEVSYNSLSSDLERVNFSSIRSGTLEERDSWRGIQGWLIYDLCKEVQPEWLRMEILTGLLPFPLSNFDQINQSKWIARSWSWVDPLKDQKANVEGVGALLLTRTDIAAEQGKDFFEMIDTIADEEAYIKEKGLTSLLPGKATEQPAEGDPGKPNDIPAPAKDDQPVKKSIKIVTLGDRSIYTEEQQNA